VHNASCADRTPHACTLLDSHARELIRVNYGERLADIWDCIAIGAVKADVWRLLALFVHGGYYFDMDSGPKPKHPFRSWNVGNHTAVSGRGSNIVEPHQWGMVYSARHPVIRQAIQNMLPQLVIRTQHAVMDVAFVVPTMHRQCAPPWWDGCGRCTIRTA
jgi:mannosyltransferase OCH1-like enzyme